MDRTPSYPCIGIFWILPNNVICAFPEKFNVEGNGRHFHDSEQSHIKLWPKVVFKHKELGDLGYEEIPRGRIIFDYRTNKFLAYVCEDFVGKPDIRKALKDAFCLHQQKIMWTTDEHYNFVTDEIDPADIDD